MKVRGMVWKVGVSSCAALALLGCDPDEVVVGERCPHPSTGRATIVGGQEAADGIYGTGCAPCDESPPEFDARGCPIYVTFESCGGNICIGDVELQLNDDDAGATGVAGAGGADAGDAAAPDAGDAGDAGLSEEDAGAH